MLNMLRVGVLFAELMATAVIKLEGMGICETVPAVRLALTRIREPGGAWFVISAGYMIFH